MYRRTNKLFINWYYRWVLASTGEKKISQDNGFAVSTCFLNLTVEMSNQGKLSLSEGENLIIETCLLMFVYFTTFPPLAVMPSIFFLVSSFRAAIRAWRWRICVQRTLTSFYTSRKHTYISIKVCGWIIAVEVLVKLKNSFPFHQMGSTGFFRRAVKMSKRG